MFPKLLTPNLKGSTGRRAGKDQPNTPRNTEGHLDAGQASGAQLGLSGNVDSTSYMMFLKLTESSSIMKKILQVNLAWEKQQEEAPESTQPCRRDALLAQEPVGLGFRV